ESAISMDVRIRLILRLALATGQRVGECRQIEWNEVDGQWWTIPAEKRKRTEDSETGEHRVFLNSHALDVLKTAKVLSDGCRYALPSPHGDKPITINAVPRAVSRNLEALGLSDFQAKDLRRTASTHMAEIGIPDPDIRRVQGHALDGMGRIYNVYHYDKEKRRALQKWDRRLREIITGKKGGKVVALR
ncbi:MAG: site-specific integrase, partial [Gammaproteobacteria bacterium]|nr:site-specific integrase [Gammaproteobacteria bacterium]